MNRPIIVVVATCIAGVMCSVSLLLTTGPLDFDSELVELDTRVINSQVLIDAIIHK